MSANSNVPDPRIDYEGHIAYVTANHILDIVNMPPKELNKDPDDYLLLAEGLLHYLYKTEPTPAWAIKLSNANSRENIIELTERFMKQIQAYKNSLAAPVDPFGVAPPRRGMTPTIPPNAGLNSAERGRAGFPMGGKSKRSRRKSRRRTNKKRKSTRRR